MLNQKQASQGTIITTLFLVSYGITLIIAGSLYLFLSRSMLHDTQQDLATIAGRMANNISSIAHEQLKLPADQDTEAYQDIEHYFQAIMSGNSRIDDVYTLRPTDKPHLMTFVVSGKPTYDFNGNGVIDENEEKPKLGEEYNTEGLDDLESGLAAPSYDHVITQDKWGSWLSGYAPLRDSQGKTIALVGVDYSAKAISDEMMMPLWIIVWVMIGAIPLYVFIAWLLVRIIRRPYRNLIVAMGEVSYGNLNYEMPVPKSGEGKMIAEFFNTMKRDLLDISARQRDKRSKE